MPEDEDPKIRRNLVTYASIVLLLAWLKVPLELVSDKLLGIGAKPDFAISQRRVWLAAGALLVYLTWRYRFSDEHQRGLKGLQDEFGALERRVIERWLSWELALSARFGINGSVLGDPQALLNAARQRLGASDQQPKFVRMKIVDAALGNFEGGRYNPSRVEGHANIVYFVSTEGSEIPMPQQQVHFKLARVHTIGKFLWVSAWLMVYSRASVAFLTPWVLTIFAGGIIAKRLWQLW